MRALPLFGLSADPGHLILSDFLSVIEEVRKRRLLAALLLTGPGRDTTRAASRSRVDRRRGRMPPLLFVWMYCRRRRRLRVVLALLLALLPQRSRPLGVRRRIILSLSAVLLLLKMTTASSLVGQGDDLLFRGWFLGRTGAVGRHGGEEPEAALGGVTLGLGGLGRVGAGRVGVRVLGELLLLLVLLLPEVELLGRVELLRGGLLLLEEGVVRLGRSWRGQGGERGSLLAVAGLGLVRQHQLLGGAPMTHLDLVIMVSSDLEVLDVSQLVDLWAVLHRRPVLLLHNLLTHHSVLLRPVVGALIPLVRRGAPRDDHIASHSGDGPLRVLAPARRVQVDLFGARVELVGAAVDDLADDLADVGLVGEALQEGPHAGKLPVLRVVVPGEDRHRVLRLKQVGHRRVVHDQQVGQRATQTRHVLHVGVAHPGAMLSEKFVGTDTLGVDDVHEGIRILRKGGRENDNFPMFVHPFQELAYSRSDQDVDIAYAPFYFHRKDYIRVLDWLKR